LMCSIRITGPENYFQIQGTRGQYEAYRQDAATGTTSAFLDAYIPNTAQMAVREGDELAIQIAPMTAIKSGLLSDSEEYKKLALLGGAGMTLAINGIKPGEYTWTVGNNENTSSTGATFNIKRDSGMTLYTSSDCVPHFPPRGESCKTISLQGITTIKEYNPATKLVNGYFQGNVLLVDPASNQPSNKYAYAIGQFTAYLMTTPIH